jgi:hypothetical protein
MLTEWFLLWVGRCRLAASPLGGPSLLRLCGANVKRM